MNILIKNALAILPQGISENSTLCIRDERIVSINSVPEDFTPDKTIDATGKLLIPGLINAHTHVHMTALRNRADDLGFMTWLFDKVMPMEDKLTEEDAYWSIQLAFMEMLRSGVTSFLDMHMFPDTVARATVDAGMRGVLSRGLQKFDNDPEGGKRRIAQAMADVERYAGISTLSFMLAPHAPYTCGEDYLREIAGLAREKNLAINTHLSESQDEQDQIMLRYGLTPAEYYDRCGILNERTVCAHCVYLSESDMALLGERGTSVAHNAASNMKLGNGIAPVPAMLAHGINVCLGSDSTASNNNQSILREMQLVSLIHKGVRRDPTTVTAEQVFDMATKNGAKALGLSDKAGEIAVGKCADLALFDLRSPGLFPLGDAKAALCYGSAGLAADTVLVNGRVLLENGEFKTIDTERVYFQLEALAKRL